MKCYPSTDFVKRSLTLNGVYFKLSNARLFQNNLRYVIKSGNRTSVDEIKRKTDTNYDNHGDKNSL